MSRDGWVGREFVDGKPADFLSFLGLAVARVAARDMRQKGGRDPMLALAGQEMIGYAQERVD